MKTLFTRILIVAMAAFAFAACTNPEDKILDKVVGEWHYVSSTEDVYVAFSADCTFELYQKMGDGLLRYRYTGTYEFDGTVLTGVYADYTPWADEYTVTSSANSLTLTSVSNPQYSMKYEREQIPEEVKTHYVPMTKGQSDGPAPVL